MIKVYHSLGLAFAAAVMFEPERFRAVAEVETAELEEAFRLTNHLEVDWRENPGVTPLVSSRCRSTSVGDVLERDGEFFAVASVGFRRIERAAGAGRGREPAPRPAGPTAPFDLTSSCALS